MPARQPFTALCRAATAKRLAGRSDLHLHTVHSDGTYTPTEVVDLARRSGLAAIAVTDHDTIQGIAAARAAASASSLEVIAGVEISAEHRGQELHLLGYFFRTEDAPLLGALKRLRTDRTGRFWAMVERLRGCGVSIDEEELRAPADADALGRRHLAELLVKARRAGSVREAFARYLQDGGRVAVAKLRLPVGEAIAVVRGAGGVASWAHPSYDCTLESLTQLRAQGLGAIEVAYPSFQKGRERALRALAAQLGLAVTGGSDCHGSDHRRRAIGACSVTEQELEFLRQMTAH